MPVGIITDNGIILRVVAKKRDPKQLAVREIMTKDPVMVIESGKRLFEAIRQFEGRDFHRMPDSR